MYPKNKAGKNALHMLVADCALQLNLVTTTLTFTLLDTRLSSISSLISRRSLRSVLLCCIVGLREMLFYWCCLHSMRSRVCVTVWCLSAYLSVSLYVCLIMGPQQQQTRCCRFAAVGPRAGGIDRLLHSRSVVTANAVNAMLSVCVAAEHRVTWNVFDIGKFTACVKGAAALSTRGPVVYEGRMKPGH